MMKRLLILLIPLLPLLAQGQNYKTKIDAEVRQVALTPKNVANSLQAIVDGITAVTATGTDTYAVTVNSVITSYQSGFAVDVKFTNANTGASTININSLGAKTIFKSVSTALASGDILAGQVHKLVYDGTNFQLTTAGGSGGGGGVSGSGTTNELAYWTGATALGTLAVATYPSLTELSYVKGLTSAAQTQLDGKWSLASGGTLTGNNTITQAGFNTTFSGTGKVTFSPSATLAGFNFGSVAGIPSGLSNGDAWYNSTANSFGVRNNGSTGILMWQQGTALNAIPYYSSVSGFHNLSANLTFDGTGMLIGGGTITASTRLDVRGVNDDAGFIIRGANQSNALKMTLNGAGTFEVGDIGTTSISVTGNTISFLEAGSSLGRIFSTGPSTRIYAGSATGTGTFQVRASSLSMNNSSATSFGSWAPTGLNVLITSTPTSTATQANSPFVTFTSGFWDGAAATSRYYGIKQVASTTVNLTGRLSFYENIATGSERETLSISTTGDVNAAILSGTNLTLGGGATASELRFLEPSGGGSSYVGFKAPALAGNTVYDLPNAFPSVSGYVLSSTDAGVMSWVASGGGSGDVVGPASATDNAIARFDATTGKLIQNSSVIVDDNAFITVGTGLTGSARELIADGSASNVGWDIRTKGNNDVLIHADLFMRGSFVVADALPTATRQIQISNTGSITAVKLSADISDFQISGAAGIGAFVTGGNLSLIGGAAHSTGNNNGGSVNLTEGAPNGSGTRGSINIASASGRVGFFGGTGVVKQSAVTTSQGIADALTAYGLLPSSTISGGSGLTYAQTKAIAYKIK